MSEENMRGNPTPNPSSNQQSSNSSSNSNSNSNNQTQPSSSSPSTKTPTTPSLATRIQSSAAGLARSAFQPGSADTAQTLANSTTSKPGAPSSSSSSSLSTTHLQTARDLSAPAQAHSASSGPQTFRDNGDTATSSIALPPMTEEEFQRGSLYSEESNLAQTKPVSSTSTNEAEPYNLQTTTGPWKGKARAPDPAQLQFETVWQRSHASDPQSDQHVNNTTDGSAVADLLSDPMFDPNFEDPVTVNDTELDISAAPPPLSAAELEALDSFRRGVGLGLDSGGQSIEDGNGRPARMTTTSLVPDIDTFLSQEGAGVGFEGTGTGTGTTSLRDDVLNRLPGAGDWVGVHERYHDEVWGFLEPVLEAAKKEIEETETETRGEGLDGPAVRRLKMILEHMKG
ncbi:hypothetical protein N7461_004173 [Penicillium sp. DV-2018c]|nr:hypothetical protein N7461_004173 [Penicillium sp. DV-2018c]